MYSFIKLIGIPNLLLVSFLFLPSISMGALHCAGSTGVAFNSAAAACTYDSFSHPSTLTFVSSPSVTRSYYTYNCQINPENPFDPDYRYNDPIYCSFACDGTDLFDFTSGTCKAKSPTSLYAIKGETRGCGLGTPSTDYPIFIGSGNKILTEQDYYYDNKLLEFVRFYSSNLAQYALTNSTNFNKTFSGVWFGTFDRSLSSVSSTVQQALRNDGHVYTFTLASGIWIPDADVTDKLTELKDSSGVRTGWKYNVDKTGVIDTYDVNGKLISIADRAGNVQSVTYSDASTPTSIAPAPGLLIVVTDSVGRQFNFSYDSTSRLASMTDPAGGIYNYAYSTDGNNNLISLTYPDSTVKTYLYENSSYPHAITGVMDENNSRYVTYAYDSAGRAYDEVLAPDLGLQIAHNNLSFSVDGNGNPISTTLTDSLGTARTFNLSAVNSISKSTGQSQPAGSGCSASAAALTYDANGNVASRTDFNGNQTTYTYDLTRNLETSHTEGLTSSGTSTAATRTITTTWHATWRLPLVITEYTGATASGTALHKTTYTYDTKGNITSIAENDPSNAITQTTTITYTYSTSVPGLILTKVVDGPRTDKSDITTYTYYPSNASCAASTGTSTATNLGCRGQLQSIKNALNQTTSYDRYNHHGQVEQMTDPNGTVTTNTYDLRQRLLTRSVSGTGISAQTTTLTYDNVGQITQLKMPDNSTLNYNYDAAHRLTQIQDTLGNKVVYTLDSEGNRTNEQSYDPAGSLTKTISRSYDALNRLQTLTGQE